MTVPETPCDIDIRVACPLCHRVIQVVMEVRAKAVTTTVDGEDETKLSAAGRVKPFAHLCGQMSIAETE